MSHLQPEPRGLPVIRTIAMPKDTNPSGDIFGGWILSQMDMAGGIAAWERAGGRAVTVGIEAMSFHTPVKVGDILSCYVELLKVGTSSIRLRIEAWASRGRDRREQVKVTEGVFTYVAIDAEGRKRRVPAAT
jgi:acyl-CoA thioesterase YciA